MPIGGRAVGAHQHDRRAVVAGRQYAHARADTRAGGEPLRVQGARIHAAAAAVVDVVDTPRARVGHRERPPARCGTGGCQCAHDVLLGLVGGEGHGLYFARGHRIHPNLVVDVQRGGSGVGRSVEGEGGSHHVVEVSVRVVAAAVRVRVRRRIEHAFGH